MQPLLLGEKDAARYLGIGPTMLRGLGLPRRKLGARRLYDRRDLDAYADTLPYESREGNREGNTWDALMESGGSA